MSEDRAMSDLIDRTALRPLMLRIKGAQWMPDHEVSVNLSAVLALIDAAPPAAPSPALTRETLPVLRKLIRAAVSDAYYEARNDGETMEQAASAAAQAVVVVLEGYAIDECPPPTGLDALIGRAILNDLLWTTTVIQRIAYPGSIAALFERTGLRPLVAEYETMIANFDAYRAALSETPPPEALALLEERIRAAMETSEEGA